LSTFADSSALVKLYADEIGHKQVRGLASMAVAQLARVEVPAALWRKSRIGELAADDARLLTADFEADYFGTGSEPPRFAVVAATGSVLDEAARLCASHGLRAYDAIQLATALAVRRADAECESFAAFDRTLRTAAATQGFELVPKALPGQEGTPR
jgi:predicted nucleic acid-binding protein